MRSKVLAGVVIVCCAFLVAGLVLATESNAQLPLIYTGIAVTILASILAKPKTLVSVLILASGMTYFHFRVGQVNLRLDTVLVPACLGSLMVHSQMGAFARQFRRPEIRLLAVYLALNFASSLAFSPNKTTSLNVCIWLTLNLVIVAMALAVFENDKQALYRRMYISAFIVVASGVCGWLLASQTGITIGANFDPTQGLRARGVSFEPNILAGVAATWILIVLTQQRRLRRDQWLFVGLAVAAIPLSTTRAAFVALAAGLAVFLPRMGIRIARFIPVAIASGVALAVAMVASPNTFALIAGKFADLGFTNQTSSFRIDSWRIAIREMAGTDWLVGKGTNSFGLRHFDPTHPGEQLPYYLGNLPLATVYDVGLVGAAVLAVVVVLLALRSGTDRHPVRRVAVLVTFLLLSIATSPFFFSEYWLFIALGLTRSKITAPTPRAPVREVAFNVGL